MRDESKLWLSVLHMYERISHGYLLFNKIYWTQTDNTPLAIRVIDSNSNHFGVLEQLVYRECLVDLTRRNKAISLKRCIRPVIVPPLGDI